MVFKIELDKFMVFKVTDDSLSAPIYILGLPSDVKKMIPEDGPGTKVEEHSGEYSEEQLEEYPEEYSDG